MSQYYKPHRNQNWNFGGERWKLSRTKLDLSIECPRCFYIDNKLGTGRPPGFPFALNSAVDTLLKKEFDIHRAKGEQHPLQKAYDIDAVPVAHEDLDKWRANFVGIQYFHKSTSMTITGAIDDLWQNSKGQYIVVDYKATAGEYPVEALDKPHHAGYKRQMEIYQWLLRQKGYKVSNVGYFVYCTGRTDKKSFDGKLEFHVRVIQYKGSDKWVEDAVMSAYKCLKKKTIPKANKNCDYCTYRTAVATHVDQPLVDKGDIILDDVVDFVKKRETVSTAVLQRKFKIGYARASRILDELEKNGVVSQIGKNNTRKVK